MKLQSYPHKILTGRRDKMHTMRQTNGLAGFTKRAESDYDCFGTGHSSTTISAGLGNSSCNLKILIKFFNHYNMIVCRLYYLETITAYSDVQSYVFLDNHQWNSITPTHFLVWNWLMKFEYSRLCLHEYLTSFYQEVNMIIAKIEAFCVVYRKFSLHVYYGSVSSCFIDHPKLPVQHLVLVLNVDLMYFYNEQGWLWEGI